MRTIPVVQERRWYNGLALEYASLGPRFEFPLFAVHLSFFDITGPRLEFPLFAVHLSFFDITKTNQIVAILSSDGTYNVICI